MNETNNLKSEAMAKKEFKKYQHIERFGTTEVQNIELGECYIFPKIDPTKLNYMQTLSLAYNGRQ